MNNSEKSRNKPNGLCHIRIYHFDDSATDYLS